MIQILTTNCIHFFSAIYIYIYIFLTISFTLAQQAVSLTIDVELKGQNSLWKKRGSENKGYFYQVTRRSSITSHGGAAVRPVWK